MTALDGVILVVIILCMVGVGLTGEKKNETTEDFFLAGRKLRWYQIGFSLFATNFSASALIGLTGAAYLTGIAIYNYEWVGILALVFFALVLVRVVRGSQVYTLSEYLERRYDARIKVLYSVFIIFLIVFIEMAGALYAGGVLLSEVIPGLSMNFVIVLVMILAGLYSVLGGLNAISKTDIFQSIVLFISALLIAYFTLAASGGWSGFIKATPDEALSLIRGLDDRAVPWTGLVVGIPVLCTYFWMVNQNMVQWVLSANSETDARRGLMFVGFLKLFILFIIIVPGIAAATLIPGLTDADRIYPALLMEYLPPGVLGIVLAGFVAALMSNTDSTLHAASTIITMDFVHKASPEIPAEKLVKLGRIITVIIIGISALWAPMIGNFGTLFEYVQGVLSYAVAPFVVIYLGGLFWPRATAKGALAALVAGFTASVLIGILGDGMGLIDIHYLYVPLPVAMISLLAFVIVSRLTTPHEVEAKLLWINTRAGHITLLDKVMAAALILLTFLLVAIFW